MILSERRTGRGLLVTVCDSDALGETYENGEVSITVSESFYGGDAVEEGEAVAALGRASVANLVGSRTVELAIREGFVDEENVLSVDGTLHAQFLRL